MDNLINIQPVNRFTKTLTLYTAKIATHHTKDYDYDISKCKTPRKRNRSVRSPTESDISPEHKRQNAVYTKNYYLELEDKVINSESSSESGGETDKTTLEISNLFAPKHKQNMAEPPGGGEVLLVGRLSTSLKNGPNRI